MSLESKPINITYDQDDGRMVVRLPIWANDLVRDMPSRRWAKSRQGWMVPVTRLNVEYIRDKVTPYAMISPGALAAMDKLEEIVKLGPKIPFPTWYKFKTEPRRHQHAALAKGYGLNAFALFMDMQTGKSKVAIDLCCAWRMENVIESMLVLCKLTLRNNWLEQFDLHSPLPIDWRMADTDDKLVYQWASDPEVKFKCLLVGFESLSQGRMPELVAEFLRLNPKTAIAGDETSYIAGHDAGRARHCVSYGRLVPKRIAMTGTPIADSPLNLYMQYEFLDPNIIGIGDFYAFKNRYAVFGGYRKTLADGKKGKPLQVVGYQNLDELIETVAPYTFQVLKKDAYDLPPKRYQTRTVQISKAQREVYKRIRSEDAIIFKDIDHTIANVLELALRLHQVAGGYTVRRVETKVGAAIRHHYDPVEIVAPKVNPKVIEIQAIIEEARHEQGVIWCVYHPEIDAVRWALQQMKIKFGELHGRVPENDRQPVVRALRDGGIQFILGNAATGGMGYPMPTSTINIFYNNTFKYIDRAQAEDRAWGDQTKASPAYIDLIAEKTVDPAIMAALKGKQDLSDFMRARISDVTRLLDGG